jgi:hypothetical protein
MLVTRYYIIDSATEAYLAALLQARMCLPAHQQTPQEIASMSSPLLQSALVGLGTRVNDAHYMVVPRCKHSSQAAGARAKAVEQFRRFEETGPFSPSSEQSATLAIAINETQMRREYFFEIATTAGP